MSAPIAELDEVVFDVEAEGVEVRRTVARRIWERAGWATVAAVFDERTRAGDWTRKLALVRLRRVHDAWRKEAAITLRAEDATALIEVLASWRSELADGSGDVSA